MDLVASKATLLVDAGVRVSPRFAFVPSPCSFHVMQQSVPPAQALCASPILNFGHLLEQAVWFLDDVALFFFSFNILT